MTDILARWLFAPTPSSIADEVTAVRNAMRDLMSAMGQKHRALRCKTACPLYPRKRTCALQPGMSAMGHKRTSSATNLFLDAVPNEATTFQTCQFFLFRLTPTTLVFLSQNPTCFRNFAWRFGFGRWRDWLLCQSNSRRHRQSGNN